MKYQAPNPQPIQDPPQNPEPLPPASRDQILTLGGILAGGSIVGVDTTIQAIQRALADGGGARWCAAAAIVVFAAGVSMPMFSLLYARDLAVARRLLLLQVVLLILFLAFVGLVTID